MRSVVIEFSLQTEVKFYLYNTLFRLAAWTLILMLLRLMIIGRWLLVVSYWHYVAGNILHQRQ